MTAPEDAVARIRQLREELERHNYLYYVLDKPEIGRRPLAENWS